MNTLAYRNHNPRVGGSSPSSATISRNMIIGLWRLKTDFRQFLRDISYTILIQLFGLV